MRTLLLSVVLASGHVTDLRGRLDALKSDHIKMACPLGSLELNATEARLLARDAADVLTTTITHARDGVGRLLGALDRKVADPRWLAGPLHVDSECRAKLEAALVAAASPARAAGRQLASKVLARATSIVLPVVLGPVALPADGGWPGLCGLSGTIPSLDPIRDALRPAMRYVRESKASLEASASVFTRAAPFVLGVLCLVTVAYATAYVTAVAWSLITSIASVLVSLTTLAALAVVATFSVFAAGAMQLEVLGLFRRDFAFHHEAGFHLVPAGAVPCALHGWLPLYCGLVAAAALALFFLAIYARSLVGRLCFWLRRARKIDVDAALIAAASGSECAICFEDPAQLLVFLPCGHRCVCASCAERIERRCPLCRARVRDRIAVVGKHKFRV